MRKTTQRAAIYARYSSDNQRAASIEDQVEVCRRYASAQGWTVTAVYDDAAESGASAFRRGFRQLAADAEARGFEVVLCEAVDRLGRRLADVAELFDRLTFAGVRLHAVNAGEITAMHVGIMGTMAQMQLADLREKTRRGQLGRALKGRIPGGRAFGYDVVAADADGGRGARRINEAEAAVVRRIFTAYANGESPRAIAKALNEEGTPGPEGRRWRDTTLRGQVGRGTGILNNALYAGRLEWNRCAYVKDPRTGRRVARPNPRETWEVVAVPHLRIVDDALWEKVKARQQETTLVMGRDGDGNALNRTHRRRYLLSGLLVCGICGGGYTVVGKDRYGCATHRSVGTCDNDRTIRRQAIEERVLSGLKDRMLSPPLLAAFLDAYHAEINAAAREAEARHAQLARRQAAVERKLAGMLQAIEDGLYTPALKERMLSLEAEKAALADARSATMPPTPIRLHPNLARLYASRVAALETALAEPGTQAEALDLFSTMIERVVLLPTEDGMAAELHGDLAAILALCDGGGPTGGGRNGKRPPLDKDGRQLSVVAGARNCLHLLVFVRGLKHRRFR